MVPNEKANRTVACALTLNLRTATKGPKYATSTSTKNNPPSRPR